MNYLDTSVVLAELPAEDRHPDPAFWQLGVRALEPFPVPVRTLDGLHLATMDYLRAQGHSIQLASYDGRMQSAARAMGFALTDF